MSHRTLHRKTCPCGQEFTTSNEKSKYHNKSCSAKYRVKRYGNPPAAGMGVCLYAVNSDVDNLKSFRG